MALPPISRETELRLRAYHDLLLKWQEKINLISPGTVKQAWARHFEDSLQLLPLLPANPFTLYDLGCGAGFPGLVLAAAVPQASVTLIESDSKKCAFLQTVSRETQTSVKIQCERIEAASAKLPAPDIVTARALASLDTLLGYIRPWAAENSALTAIFPKGIQAEQELETAQKQGWLFHVKQTASLTEPQAKLLVLTEIRKK